MKHLRKGFTLIELMIVVAIIAILAAIAYPSYVRYLVRTHVSAGQAYLMDLAQREQQYLLDNRSYADLTTITGLVAAPSSFADDYTLAVDLDKGAQGPKPNFIATATPTSTGYVAKYGGDKYYQTLSITNAGVKIPATLWQ